MAEVPYDEYFERVRVRRFELQDDGDGHAQASRAVRTYLRPEGAA